MKRQHAPDILCRERDEWLRFDRAMSRRGYGPLDEPRLVAHAQLAKLVDWRELMRGPG